MSLAREDELASLRAEVAELRARLARTDAEQASRAADRLLEELGRELPWLFWVRDVASQTIRYANPAWTTLLGRAPVIGEHFGQLFATVHADDRAVIEAATADASAGRGYDVLVRLRDAQGATRWVRLRTVAIRHADGGSHRIVGLGEDVTEQHQLLAELRESEAKYRELFEHAQVGIFRARSDGSVIVDVNARFCEIVAASREEVLGRPPRTWWSDPEHRARMLAELNRTGWLQDFEARMMNARGEPIWVLASAKLDADGFYEGSIIDITARKQAERALRDSEARYRSVVDAMTAGIVVHDQDGVIVASNAAAERILGLTVDQMMGRTSLDPRWRAIREDGSPFPGEEHPGWVTLRTGEPRTGVTMGVHKPSGELTWISINSRRVTPLGEEGAYSVVASFTDITEKKLADERVLASLREKEVLLKEVHHRVKNNLQIVTSLLYLQAMRADDARLGELLRESRDRIASIALVHQQLYEAPELSRIPFDTYVRDLAASLYRSYGVSPERIALRVAADGLVLSVGTAVPCGLVLNELLSNALKYAFPDGRSGTISIELALEGDTFRLRVSDDGVGLPDDLERRARTSLGMKLIERLAAQLGATLRREGGPRGATFELVFARDGAS